MLRQRKPLHSSQGTWLQLVPWRTDTIIMKAAFLLMQSAEKPESHILDIVRENLARYVRSVRCIFPSKAQIPDPSHHFGIILRDDSASCWGGDTSYSRRSTLPIPRHIADLSNTLVGPSPSWPQIRTPGSTTCWPGSGGPFRPGTHGKEMPSKKPCTAVHESTQSLHMRI